MNWLTAVGLVLAMTLLGFLMLFGPNVLDFDRCPIRRWLAAGIFASVCLGIAEVVAIPGTRAKLVIAGAAITLAALLFAGMPARDHAFRHGMLGANAAMVWGTMSLSVTVGVAAFLNRGATRSRDRPFPRRIVQGHLACSIAVTVLGGVLATILLKQRIFGVGESDWTSFWTWLVALPMIGIGHFAWSMHGLAEPDDTIRARPAIVHSITALTAAALAAGIAVFVLRRMVQGSAFLRYHMSNVRLEPIVEPRIALGLGGLLLIACGFSIAAHRRWRCRAELPSSVLAVLAIGLGWLHFCHVNFFSESSVLTRAIVCLNVETGNVEWICEGLGGPEGLLHRANSPATPTPVIADDRILAHFGAAGVMCADRHGNRLWENREVRFEGIYGVGASPASSEGVLILSLGASPDERVVALDVLTGQLLWHQPLPLAERRVSGSNRTPLVVNRGGRSQVLVWGVGLIRAFDVHTGRILATWSINEQAGDMVASLVCDGTHLLCSTMSGTYCFDTEMANGETSLIWHRRHLGPNCASPVVVSKLLFTVADGGVATCLDTKTGEVFWRRRFPGAYYSSPIAFGNSVYFTNLEGHTTVVAAEKRFVLIAKCDLDDGVFASPAAVDDGLIMRSEKYLWRIGPDPRH